MSNTDPNQTLRLLDKLESLGFDNSAFRVIHHKGGKIDTHRKKGCENRELPFEENGKDSLVQRRLEFVLREFNDVKKLFRRLAAASRIEVE